MSIQEILSEYGTVGGISILVILSLIEISPIKINPISWVINEIGKALNKETLDKIGDLKTEIKNVDNRVSKLENTIEENNVIQCRIRILHFGDEVSHGVNHSRDNFKQVMQDITVYDAYCRDHPNFQNDMTKITAKRIEEDYIEKDKNDSFLY